MAAGLDQGKAEGIWRGGYDVFALGVDAPAFFVPPELSDFFVSAFSELVAFDSDPDSEPADSDLPELPFERFPPLRLSFL